MPLAEQFTVCSVLKRRLLDTERTDLFAHDEYSWRDSMLKGSISKNGDASRLDIYIPVRSSPTTTLTTQSSPITELLLEE